MKLSKEESDDLLDRLGELLASIITAHAGVCNMQGLACPTCKIAEHPAFIEWKERKCAS